MKFLGEDVHEQEGHLPRIDLTVRGDGFGLPDVVSTSVRMLWMEFKWGLKIRSTLVWPICSCNSSWMFCTRVEICY